MLRALRALLAPFFVLGPIAVLLVACGDDNVGGACVSHSDCEEMCATGKDFPGGMCTYHCNVSGQCPDGWACIEKDGGICMGTCPDSGFCRNQFGPGYACKDKDLRGEPGKAPVCIGD